MARPGSYKFKLVPLNNFKKALLTAALCLGFSNPLNASKETCRGSLSAYDPTPIQRYPNISKEVETKLKTLLPTIDTTSLDLFLAYVYGVYAEAYELPHLKSGRPFKQLKKLPYDIQIDFFTYLKNHSALYENPPGNILPFNKAGSPQYLREHERAALKEALARYELPDVEASIYKLFPLKEEELLGTFEVIFTTVAGSYNFSIDTANDGTSVVTQGGKLLDSGNWSFKDGNLRIQAKNPLQISLKDVPYNALVDGHTFVGRIHEWGPIGVCEIYFSRESD